MLGNAGAKERKRVKPQRSQRVPRRGRPTPPKFPKRPSLHRLGHPEPNAPLPGDRPGSSVSQNSDSTDSDSDTSSESDSDTEPEGAGDGDDDEWEDEPDLGVEDGEGCVEQEVEEGYASL
jgi:hypothetical protein